MHNSQQNHSGSVVLLYFKKLLTFSGQLLCFWPYPELCPVSRSLEQINELESLPVH